LFVIKIQMVSVFSLALLAVACSKKESGGASTTGAFLKPADFSNLTFDQLSGTDALKGLKESSAIYDNKPDTASTPTGDGDSDDNDPFEACEKKNQPTIKIVDGSTINVDANIDILQCLKEQAASSGQAGGGSQSVDGGQFAMRFVFNITCPGADFSEFQGKKIDEIGLGVDDSLPSPIESKCRALESIKTFVNASFILKSPETGDKAFEVNMKMAQFTKEGDACTQTKVAAGYQSNGCLTMNYSAVNFGGMIKKNLTVFESSNLLNGASSTATWFAGGAYKVSINNFTGTLTYTGADTAPSYSLTGAGETLTGNLNNTTLALESVSPSSSAKGLISGQWNHLISQARAAWSNAR